MTGCWHVDDLKTSHKMSFTVTEMLRFLSDKDSNLGVLQGKVHDYLATQFNFSEKGRMKMSMQGYEDQIFEDFLEEIGNYANSPAADNLL